MIIISTVLLHQNSIGRRYSFIILDLLSKKFTNCFLQVNVRIKGICLCVISAYNGTPTEEQKNKIRKTAQGIIDARKLYPDSSLADLYKDIVMSTPLREAHQGNDCAVMQAYGFDIKTITESSCVAELMKMYKKLTESK